MKKEQVKSFLRKKPGYLKEGAGRLSKKLSCNFNTCKQALKEVRQEYSVDTKITPKRLFYDIETSYNIVKSWRIGYNLNVGPQDIIHERGIICVSWKWEGQDKVQTLYWNNGCDKVLVKKFIKIMGEADELVGHNIDRYDTRFLMTRAIKHGILALPKYSSYDTLKKARKHFSFNSNKLDYIARILGLGGKMEHSGLKMWDDIVLYDILGIGSKRKRDVAFKTMITYCEQDVVLTEEVFNKLKNYTEHNVHHAALHGLSKHNCPNCGSSNVKLEDRYITKAGTPRKLMKCKKCRLQFFISNTEYLKLLKE